MLTLKATWRKMWGICGTLVLIHQRAWTHPCVHTYSTPKSAEAVKAVGYVHAVAVEINSIIKRNTKMPCERKGYSASFGKNLILPILCVIGHFRGLEAQDCSQDVGLQCLLEVHKSLLLPSLKFLAGTCLLSSGLFSTGHLPGEEICLVSPIVCSHSQSVYLWALLAVQSWRSACPYHLDLERQLITCRRTTACRGLTALTHVDSNTKDRLFYHCT